jgi:tRNA-specific 2-thiouridylase
MTFRLFDTGDIAAGGGGKKSCCSLEDVNDARDAAYRLDIPHYVPDCRDLFRENVMRRFVDAYRRGETPNPCIDCNRFVKFSALLRRAGELEARAAATGHYARVEKSGARHILKKALDAAKDQSYVLYAMSQKELALVKFPLGGLEKKEVRRIAEQYGLSNAGKRESQDICFVPDGDYGAFIEHWTGFPLTPGDIVDQAGGVIGRHRGIERCTIGQRRGLGVAANTPVYVTGKSAAANTVTLGPEEALYSKSLAAHDINLIALEKIGRPMRVSVQTRYRQKEAPATVEQTGDDSFTVIFDSPQRAVTPGQAVVLYDGDVVIGGGVIGKAG